MDLKVGILIVGSLYWDGQMCAPACKQNCQNCSRESWRQKRLRMKDAVTVEVPIHYGRRSKTRGNTYSSIVFDAANKMGQARVVPCLTSVKTLAELVGEATAMWTAEKNGDNEYNEISAKWGCVALLPHPEHGLESLIPPDLLKGWANRIATEHANYENRISVDRSGRLLIDWPKQVKGEELNLDLLLATANFPDGKAPTEKEIAKAYWEDDLSHVDYFIKNRKSGITTPSDNTILMELAKLLT